MIGSSTLILVLKLFLSPILIAAATLIGRRWGPAASGWFTGFPFISAPISIIMALQNGLPFASQAAAGTIGGQTSVCLFAIAYILAAQRFPWWICTMLSLGIFFGAAALWNSVGLSLLPALIILLGMVLLLAWSIPVQKITNTNRNYPWWDLPARMLAALIFVAVLTSASKTLGPQLSGIFSAFPVFGLVLAAFTHAQQGRQAARQLLRGSILGSFGIAGFYMIIGSLLLPFNSLWTYLLAAGMAVAANRISLYLTTRSMTRSSHSA